MYSYIIATAKINNNDGKLLMVNNVKVGKWGYPGGKVEIGENPRDAVIREVKEELGIDIEVIKAEDFKEFYWETDKAYWIEIIYSATIKSGTPEIKEPEKLSGLEWR